MKRTAKRAAQPTDYTELAVMLSGVLNHPLVPNEIYTELSESISNLMNTESIDSPETIGSVLYHHAKRQEGSKR